MRAALLALAWMGCGAVRLGDETPWDDGDAQLGVGPGAPASTGIDAGLAEAPIAVVSVAWAGPCAGCADLRVQAVGGTPPYDVEWADGLDQTERRVCGDDLTRAQVVVITDATGARSAPHITNLMIGDASCPADADAGALIRADGALPIAPLICVQNPSFEGIPAFNSGNVFDAAPWSACTNPSVTNTPEIANDSVGPTIVSPVPQPTSGTTFLGLMEDEQVSQALCRGVSGGTSASFRIDLRRLYVGANVVPDTEASFLEVWGGLSGDCSARELLWASPKLDTAWNTYCVTVRPKVFFDNLVLISRSDKSLPATTYLLADHIVPVESCPLFP